LWTTIPAVSAVLIEGPPDANELLPLASNAGLEPPVALLVNGGVVARHRMYR